MVRLAETNPLFPWGQSGRDTGPAGAGPGARRARATSFQAGGLQRGLCPTDAPFSGLEPLTPLCHEPGPTGRKTSLAPPWDPLRSFIDGDVPGSPPRPALTAHIRVSGGLARPREAGTVGFSGRQHVGTSGAAVASPVLTPSAANRPETASRVHAPNSSIPQSGNRH